VYTMDYGYRPPNPLPRRVRTRIVDAIADLGDTLQSAAVGV
jgi:hypothetical protein